MAIPISLHPEDEAILTYPKEPTMYKKHVIIKMAREFKLMPLCDVRAPKPIKSVVDAQESEMTVFRDAP